MACPISYCQRKIVPPEKIYWVDAKGELAGTDYPAQPDDSMENDWCGMPFTDDDYVICDACIKLNGLIW